MKIYILLVSLLFSLSSFSQVQIQSGWMGPNFHTIEKGRAYRSAQLDTKEMQNYIDKYKIKTVINLRGVSDSKWWINESKLLESLNVDLVNIPMSASRLPHREDLISLIESFESVKYPILIHCQAGADRTGEAAAIYQMLHMEKSKKKALKMLSFKYWHVSFFKPAKKYFIKNLWKGKDWVYNSYFPCKNNWKYYKKEKYCM